MLSINLYAQGMSKAVLTALLERSICPYQRSLLLFSMRSRSSIPSRASSSMDLMVAVSCGLKFQICLIIALSFRCRPWRQGFVTGQVSLAWSIALRTHMLYTLPRVLKERWPEERTGFSSLNFFQAVFNVLWLKAHNHRLLRACLLGSKRKLPPPVCQAQLGLLSVVCRLRDVLFPCTMYTCNQGPLSSALAHCTSYAPSAYSLCRRCCCCPLQCDRQYNYGNSPELCRRSSPVPQIMIFVFPAFTLSPFSSIASFHLKSLSAYPTTDLSHDRQNLRHKMMHNFYFHNYILLSDRYPK